MSQVVVGVVEHQGRVLLVQRKDRSEGLTWVYPGGKVEDAESPEQAVIREVLEEAGVMVSEPVKIGERVHPQTGVLVTYYRCVFNSQASEEVQDSKISQVAWVNPENLGEEFFRG